MLRRFTRPGTHAPTPPGDRRRIRGQSVVEFALVLPILLLLLAATIDFGRLFYTYVAVDNAAKEGALYGARSPLCDDSANPACADPNNVTWHVANEASNLVDSSGNSLLTATVACRDTAGVLVQPINNCVDGYTYQVTVTSPFRLITPLLSSIVGQTIVLRSESQATVISDAFDPTGLEALIWVDKTGSTNAAAITTVCVQADSVSSAGYYYQPCQDSINVDNYLQFQENTTVNYKVRIRNTGNINLTNVTYAFTINGVAVGTPGNCSTLPANLASGSGAFYCTFSRAATSTNPGNGIDDDTVSIAASGSASGLPTGATNGGATIKVAPAPRLAVNLQASPYRLGGSGYGTNGVANYSNGALGLARNTVSALTEIQNPTGWFYLNVVNQGGAASNFNVSVTQAGSPISLPGSCVVPSSLAASGQAGDSFSCIFPRTFNATTAYAMVASASATNAIIVGGQQPAVTVTTATCVAGKLVVPNLVDTLNPTADGSNKTVGQAKVIWPIAGFTGALTTAPAGAANGLSVINQGVTAYTCQNTNTAVTVGAQ
jgi:Flp pilus assembly protein TadG